MVKRDFARFRLNMRFGRASHFEQDHWITADIHCRNPFYIVVGDWAYEQSEAIIENYFWLIEILT